MDRIDAMQAFVRVVETGSFTKAAQTLQTSKTTVSQLVQQLEARLRVKLLNRTTRKVNLTAEGADYHAQVVRLLADLEEAESALSGASSAPRGRLRVDVPSPLASLLLVPALPDFYARYPEIALDLGASDRKIDLIDERVDCVIRGGTLEDPNLAARHVADLQLGVYAAPAYLQRTGIPAHPRELEDGQHRILGYRWARTGRPLPIAMRHGGEELRINGQHALTVDDGNAYLAAGIAGLGVLWLPEYMAVAAAARGELVRLFDDWAIDPMPMYVAYPPKRHVSRRLRVFIDWVVELLAPYAPLPPGPARGR